MRWSLSFSVLAAMLLATPVLSAPTLVERAAAAATSPASGAVIVDATGAKSSYKTVQAGVNALSTSATGTQTLFIYPGVYKEQVYIASRKANLIIQGYTTDTSSYKNNKVNITYSLALADTTTDDLTATVRNWASNTKFYNVNILNTYGHSSNNGQALALSAYATNQGYYGVGLYGYQDTLLANTGTQLYANSIIEGAVDFIFGQHAQAWLTNIDIYTIGPGAITASGRNSTSDASWYVINKSNVKALTSAVATGSTYLGRPWGNYARVTFQNTYMTAVVNSAGWEQWNVGDPHTDHVTLEEYGNTGPGASGTRASFSTKLSAAVPIASILGSSYASAFYVDSSYL